MIIGSGDFRYELRGPGQQICTQISSDLKEITPKEPFAYQILGGF